MIVEIKKPREGAKALSLVSIPKDKPLIVQSVKRTEGRFKDDDGYKQLMPNFTFETDQGKATTDQTLLSPFYLEDGKTVYEHFQGKAKVELKNESGWKIWTEPNTDVGANNDGVLPRADGKGTVTIHRVFTSLTDKDFGEVQ